jgi:S-adenosylmethionine hydrolase
VQIQLFTDFGAADLYIGQVHAVLAAAAPGVPVIDLFHDAPRFDPRAGAHLLAALVARLPAPGVIMAVVDPGVGGKRRALAVRAGDRWLVGPDNGLLSVAAERAGGAEVHEISWRPEQMSATFHGRDLFAPIAARLARGDDPATLLARCDGFAVRLGAGDLPEIICIDHYGNAVTGIRAGSIAQTSRLRVGEHRVHFAQTFSDAPAGMALWYEGSLGLAEIAVNGGSAAEQLAIAVGDQVSLDA